VSIPLGWPIRSTNPILRPWALPNSHRLSISSHGPGLVSIFFWNNSWIFWVGFLSFFGSVVFFGFKQFYVFFIFALLNQIFNFKQFFNSNVFQLWTFFIFFQIWKFFVFWICSNSKFVHFKICSNSNLVHSPNLFKIWIVKTKKFKKFILQFFSKFKIIQISEKKKETGKIREEAATRPGPIGHSYGRSDPSSRVEAENTSSWFVLACY
jgi:hypothetical protein